jgi:hypothetical protein
LKLNPQDAQILFFGTGGLTPVVAPQVKDFTVYYTLPPVVGLMVVEELPDTNLPPAYAGLPPPIPNPNHHHRRRRCP